MKKTNLKKYILEALGTLLVIAACLTVHTLSERKAYADDVVITWGTKGDAIIYYKDSEDKNNELSVKSFSGQIMYKINKKEDTIKIDSSLSSFKVSDNSASNFKLKINSVTLSDDTPATIKSGADSISGDMNDGNLLFDISSLELVSTTAKPTIEWSASASVNPSITYSDGSTYSGVTIKDYTGTIKYNNDSSSMSINKISSGSFQVAGSYSDYRFYITSCTLSDDSTGTVTSGSPITGTLDGTKLTFDTKDLVVKSSKTKPEKVNWTATITPNVYYSDGTTVKSGVTVSGYKGTITGASGSKFYFTDITASNSIETSIDHDEIYTMSITGCTLSDGCSVASVEGTATAKIDENKTLSFTINSLKITETYASTVNKYTSSNITSSTTDADDDIKLAKVTVSNTRAKSIIAAQTKSTIQNKVIEAMQAGQKLSVGVVVKDYDSKSDVDESGAASSIEDKAEESESSAKIGKYFDISLYLMVDDIIDTSDDYKITDAGNGNGISFTYTVPSSVKSSSSSSTKSRKYRLYRYHGGSSHSVGDWDTDTTIKFTATEFSTYGLAYYDASSSNTSSSSVAASNSASVKNTIDTTASANKTSGKSPKTGDNFNPRIWIYLLIVAATIATCAGVLLHDTKDTDEAERK